ncbi:ATP synthase F0 subunit B [bacterium]|nr:ATP synthase F0 subunit B [bacterium]MBT3853472.1 ATP synthase F0 subunit B [bacterium]MBT4632434.1 ATP synthase F0 subunit B [bacterium]MBT6778890.1 ATP synthase F0 subunit B [bacterium]
MFFIFYYFLGDTIIKTIEERRSKLENLDNSDDVVREKIEAAEKEAEVIIEGSRNKALEMQKNADEISKKDTIKKIQDAEEKAQGIMDSARRDVEKERLGMLNEMKNKVLDLSLKINSKVFNNKDNNKEFINKEVNSIKL